MSKIPDFIIVCNHRIRGGHLDGVVRYTWPPHSNPGVAHWGVPIPGPSGEVRQTQIAGNRPKPTRSSQRSRPTPHAPRDHLRDATLPVPAYRSDVARLQTLFRAIADNDVLRDVLAVSVTDTAITITLEALHLGRDTARRTYGLHV